MKIVDALDASEETGAAVLFDQVHAFLGRFIVYPSQHAHVAHTLWVAHTFVMDAWESTPRIAFLSPEPASGKTRALEVSVLLVPRPVEAINVTPAYLFRKVGSDAGPPTILYDEIDTVFGPKAKDNEEIRALLNAGHRRGDAECQESESESGAASHGLDATHRSMTRRAGATWMIDGP